MKRISFPSPETMSAAQQSVYQSIISGPRGELVGPLRAALHNPELADRWQKLGQVLRYETCLPRYLNELAILVTARHWNSSLEWEVHTRDAIQAGIQQEWIERIKIGDLPDFSADLDAMYIYEYTRQLLATGDVQQAVYAQVMSRWGEVGVVDLTAVIGYYCMVALTLNVHRIPIPVGMPINSLSNDGALFVSPCITCVSLCIE